jgi:hypothetical protein
VHANAQRLALDVEAGIEDGADRIGLQPARGGADVRIERRIDATDGARVLADQACAQPMDQGGEPAAAAFLELRPAHQPLVGGDLEKRIGVPAAVDMEVLDLRDLHRVPSRSCPSIQKIAPRIVPRLEWQITPAVA